MKFYLRILICLGMQGASTLYAQQPDWLWAKSGGGLKQDQSSSVAVDSAGNIFITGYYQDSAIFSGQKIFSSKGQHFFLAKYSTAGAFQWVKTSALKGSSAGTGLCICQKKYLCLTGYFSDSLAIGDTILFNPQNTGTLFLAKYDLDGNKLWAKAENAIGADSRKGIAADRFGNVYVCGSFAGAANFGGLPIPSSGGSDLYFVKYTPGGSVVWAKSFGTPSNRNAAIGITIDRFENIILTGSFGDTIDFGVTKLIAKGTSDIFVLKCDSGGNILWASQGGALDLGEGVSVTTDRNQDIYATGSFSGAAISADCDGIGNILIAKYSGAGILQWMKCEGTEGEQNGNSIAIDSSDFLYVTGGYDFIVDLGTGELPWNGLIDVFLVKLDHAGTTLWAAHAGSAGTDMGNAVALDPAGNIYVSGIFSDTSVFGSIPLESRNLTDIFIAKIGAAADVPDAHAPATASLTCYPNPAKDVFTIETRTIVGEEKVTVEFYSVLGQRMKKMTFSNPGTSVSMPVSDLASGTYYCHLSGTGLNEFRMVVVNR